MNFCSKFLLGEHEEGVLCPPATQDFKRINFCMELCSFLLFLIDEREKTVSQIYMRRTRFSDGDGDWENLVWKQRGKRYLGAWIWWVEVLS